MSIEVEFLDLDDVLELAARLLGDPPPLRDVGLLASAVARPQTTVGGGDAYGTIWMKAAALLESVVNNHSLVDGNKRLGWLTTAVFLELNDAGVAHADNEAIYEFVMDIASGHVQLEQIAARLEALHDHGQ